MEIMVGVSIVVSYLFIKNYADKIASDSRWAPWDNNLLYIWRKSLWYLTIAWISDISLSWISLLSMWLKRDVYNSGLSYKCGWFAIEDKLIQMNGDLDSNFTFYTLTSKQFVFGSNSKVIERCIGQNIIFPPPFTQHKVYL